MNEEQLQQGREALIGLGWEAVSIDKFAHTICNNDVKKQIAKGLLPFLQRVVLDLETTKTDLDSLITHIQEFNND